MRSWIAVCAGAIAIVTCTVVGVIADGQRVAVPLTLNNWVTLYERDPLDASIRLSALTDGEAYRLRDTIMGAAHGWPKGAPPLRDPLLTLAALAIELECTRVDTSDWRVIAGHNSGEFAVERAVGLIERRATTDAAAHAWWRVALTLGEVNHANYAMFKPTMTHPPVRFDFLRRAMAMFPGDIGFRFTEARLHASSVSAILELDSPHPGVVQAQPGVFALGMGYQGAPSKLQSEHIDQARLLLSPLIDDPTFGAETQFWAGYLRWVTGETMAARDTISAVANSDGRTSSVVRDVRYAASVLLGYIDQALGRVDDAEADYRAALRIRPKSQSASIGLAALLYRDGEAEEAERLVHESLGPRGSDDDPWRLLQYGDFAKLPAQLDTLRHAVTGAAK